MRAKKAGAILAATMLAWLVAGADVVSAGQAGATIKDLLDLTVKPFAIGHRGFGDNLGEDPTRPIENTLRAVRLGFKAGVSVVEVDVQLTIEDEVVVFHDDFLAEQLPDGKFEVTCLNSLTTSALRERVPWVPTLSDVLETAREWNERPGHMSGLMIIELKAAAPLCDPDDSQERAIVKAVTKVVRKANMTDRVMFTSLSPALLAVAANRAPEIVRILSISGLQFLTADELADYGLSATLIDKQRNLGLQWAEVADSQLGPIYRLPGYRSIDEVLSTSAITGVRLVEADLLFLNSAGPPFVETLHAFGLKVLGFTADSPEQWFFLESLGLDGIYTNDISFGVAHEAPIP